MASVRLNDAELDALKGLPLAARVVYVEGVRPFMDYVTGIVGDFGSKDKSISLQSLAEVLYVEPHRGRTGTGSRSRKQARVCVDVLVDAGLIRSLSVSSQNDKRLILKCVLADTDLSVQNKQGTNRAHKQGANRAHKQGANRAQSQAAPNNGLDTPETPKQGTPETPKQGTPETPKQGAPPLTVTHNYTHISREAQKTTCPPDFQIDKAVLAYMGTSPVPKDFCEGLVDEFRLANIASGFQSLNWPAEFVKYCMKQWRYQQSFINRNDNKKKPRNPLRLVSQSGPSPADHGFYTGDD